MTDALTPNSAPPPTPPRKTQYVGFRLTEAQRMFAQKRVTANHMTLSEYMCWLVNGDMERYKEWTAAYKKPHKGFPW